MANLYIICCTGKKTLNDCHKKKKKELYIKNNNVHKEKIYIWYDTCSVYTMYNNHLLKSDPLCFGIQGNKEYRHTNITKILYWKFLCFTILYRHKYQKNN